jgi:hypothetical protein
MKKTMDVRHAAATLGFVALGIGALTITAPHAATAEPFRGDCDFRVEVALTEALEGVYAPDGWMDQHDIMHDACEQLGAGADARVFEDGSWVIENTDGIFWRGCVSTEAPCADTSGM